MNRQIKDIFFFLLFASGISAQTGDMFNRFRLGQSYEQAGDLQRAKTIYEDLIKNEPDNFQFFDALNRIYNQLKEFDKSISLIESRLNFYPQDINLKGLLGATYYLKNEEEKAFKIWDDALEQSPPTTVNYRVIANFAIERRAFNKAVEILSKGKKLSDDTFYISYELANLYSILMQYKEAADEFCSVLKKQPGQLNVVQSRMSAYINKPEAVIPTIETIEKWAKDSDDNSFPILLAWLYMQNNQFDKAYEKYLEIETQRNNGGSDIFSFAQQAYQAEHYKEAAKAFNKVIADYPNSPFTPNAKIGYAKTFEAMLDKKNDFGTANWKPYFKPGIKNSAEYNEAISAYSQLTQNNKNSDVELEAYYRIGLIYFEKFGEVEEAEKYFKKILTLNLLSRFSILSYNQLASIELSRSNLQAAFDYFNQINSAPRATSEDRNQSQLMQAKIEFWRGNFSSASKLLNIVIKNLSDNNANDAIELSLIINSTKNDSLSLVQFAKAERLTQQDKYAEAKEIYSTLSDNQNLLIIKDLSSLRSAEMLIGLDKLPESVSMLKNISEQKEKNIYSDQALFLLGKVYQFGINDNIKAQESYENLLANFPNSLYLDDARENITLLKNKSMNNL
ncbi:MAG: tetratricopeptide repeat protein [Ignavibacteriales bacterium]|nr:tetratricopeptide repeat protein [Ignavibacteriales bacterium]